VEIPRTMAHRSNSHYRQRGIMTVEFIIVAPLLMLLLIAVSEFGHALYQYNTLTKSVRDGARYLAANAISGSTVIIIDSTDIEDTENLVVYGTTANTGSPILPGLATSHVTVSCLGGGTACPGVDHIVVAAQYPYRSIMGATLAMFGYGADISLGITLTSTITMRAL
jgi:Flp pilus assembly protein TadG